MSRDLKTAPKKQAQKVLKTLKEIYPVSSTALKFDDPWQLMVAVQLSAQCTDARVNLVTPEFFSRWPGPAELAEAELGEVEEVIHSTGFFRNKAKNLVGAAKMIRDEYGGKLPDNMEDLIRLPGVARKTANVTLYAGFGINAGLAVDTHVRRVSYRLGLTENTDPIRIERDLLALFPQSEWGDLNCRMVEFGRDMCKARKPRCEKCPMARFCPKNSPPADGESQASLKRENNEP